MKNGGAAGGDDGQKSERSDLSNPHVGNIERIVRLAAEQLDVPMAVIVSLENDQQHVLSAAHLDASAVPNVSPLLSATVERGEILEVPDILLADTFAADVSDRGDRPVRFYAGIPLTASSGRKLGVLCVMDTVPRQLDCGARRVLTDLAMLAVGQIEAERNSGIVIEHRHATRVVEEAPLCIRSSTPDLQVTYINRAGRELLGYAQDTLLDGMRVDHHHPEWVLTRLYEEGFPTASSAGLWTGETAIIGADGRETPASQLIVAHRNETGDVEYFTSFIRDISARRTAEHAVRESEARFRGTFENAAVGMAHVGFDGRWLRVNERLLNVLGYSRGEILQTTFPDVMHPGDRQVNNHELQRLQRGETDTFSGEKRCIHKDGRMIWVNLTASLQRSDAGQPLYCIATIEDISLRKEAEERQRLLLAELNHRVKNTLATIQSIANQTLRQALSPQDFVKSFRDRLQSLSGAHDLLTAAAWKGADLDSLVRNQITLNGAIDASRISSSGPAISLSPQIALNLALVFHELATNAIKHGALAQASGRIDVRWSLDESTEPNCLDIVWIESGGPSVCEPERRGFGSLILERGLEQGLGGKASLDWHPSGLQARIALPLPKYAIQDELFNP